MESDRPGTTTAGDNTTMLHDVVNQLVSQIFESDAAREHLRDTFPSSAAVADDDSAKRVLSNFTAAVQHNLSPALHSWIAENNLAPYLVAVKTGNCYTAALPNDENNAPEVNRPAHTLAHLNDAFKRQHLDQLNSALAARERRLEQLRSELRQQIDEATTLCRKLDALSSNTPASASAQP